MSNTVLIIPMTVHWCIPCSLTCCTALLLSHCTALKHNVNVTNTTLVGVAHIKLHTAFFTNIDGFLWLITFYINNSTCIFFSWIYRSIRKPYAHTHVLNDKYTCIYSTNDYSSAQQTSWFTLFLQMTRTHVFEHSIERLRKSQCSKPSWVAQSQCFNITVLLPMPNNTPFAYQGSKSAN